MECMATGYQDKKKIRVGRALESFGTGEVLSEGWCVQYVYDEAGKKLRSRKWRLRSGAAWLGWVWSTTAPSYVSRSFEASRLQG